MAELRMVHTTFWNDEYIESLSVEEKYLFLYFLTNPSTHICGVYQILMKYISVDTGIPKERIEKILEKFEKDGKMKYRNNWLAIRNFLKNQRL